MGKIGVFPAAGALGSCIYRHLLQLVDAKEVVLVSRYPEKTPSQYVQAGVTRRTADYDKLGTLGNAFDDVSHLILISYPGLEIESRNKVHRDAVDAAIQSGVSNVFYTSFALGGESSTTSVSDCMASHLTTEAYFKSLPAVPNGKNDFFWTSIRVALYSESYYLYTAFLNLKNPGDVIRIPHDGSGPGIPWAKTDELGEAIATVVHRHWAGDADIVSEYNDQVVLLTGPKAYSLSESINIIGAALNTAITIEEIDIEKYVDDPIVQTCLAPYAAKDAPRKWASTFEAIKRGEAAETSTRLEKILGRQPEDYETTIKNLVRGARGDDPPEGYECKGDIPALGIHYAVEFDAYTTNHISKRQMNLAINEVEGNWNAHVLAAGLHQQDPLPGPNRQWDHTTQRPPLRFEMHEEQYAEQTMKVWMVTESLECIREFVGLWDQNVPGFDLAIETYHEAGVYFHEADGNVTLLDLPVVLVE
ncbi:uncharacterized protein KY384_000282 [Bacidia gigantensis]|uniref:uncharacterized protein n=1 Tax=Bacidia gigantensis TaxID=2732470 RepID=UPI001D04E53E|nr:uncharacterized protein KY384_000282 [Bacidia gigantensis]KAG8526289.1 hypothetical protein KY384_000282 [Bacidia gigantensis]